jgi:hypothetical protein
MDSKVYGTLIRNKDGREIPEDEFIVFRPADEACLPNKYSGFTRLEGNMWRRVQPAEKPAPSTPGPKLRRLRGVRRFEWQARGMSPHDHGCWSDYAECVRLAEQDVAEETAEMQGDIAWFEVVKEEQEKRIVEMEEQLETERMRVVEMEEQLETERMRVVEMEEQLETERMRVVACGVAAGCNTEESIARHGIKQGNPYWTPAYGDVCGAVKREMEYREKNKALEDQVGALINRLNMCETIAKCGPDFVFPKEGDHSYSDAARAVLDLRREWNTLREREKAYADRLAVFITWLCSIAPGSPMRSDKHQAAATKGRTDRQLHAALTGKGKSRKPVSKKHRGARR